MKKTYLLAVLELLADKRFGFDLDIINEEKFNLIKNFYDSN